MTISIVANFDQKIVIFDFDFKIVTAKTNTNKLTMRENY